MKTHFVLATLKNYKVAILKKCFTLLLLLGTVPGFSQNCNCEKEFLYIKDYIEQNYVGFEDKLRQLTKGKYQQLVKRLHTLSRTSQTTEDCLLLITRYLDSFKDQHIQIIGRFNTTVVDSVYISQQRQIQLTDKELSLLRQSNGIEGIYYYKADSSYRIAVIKEKTLLSDYIGVILDSKLPTWKKGQVKFAAKQVNDSLLRGVLFIRNHMPKVEWFPITTNQIGGDWQREGTATERADNNNASLVARQLSNKTLYLRIADFSPTNAKPIELLIRAHEKQLLSTPNLILDLRNNGGGADFAYRPLLPYISTGPVKSVGIDVLATEANIKSWKALLDDNSIPEQNKQSIRSKIEIMELNKGKRVSIIADHIDSTFPALPYPQKVIILINKGCASTTEQFLLYARQSSKVILAGDYTQGTLDYSNMRDTPFPWMPYTLRYATTRSRRLDIGDGIDNKGIKPTIMLPQNVNWVEAAQMLVEK